jgi:hypothetical protein
VASSSSFVAAAVAAAAVEAKHQAVGHILELVAFALFEAEVGFPTVVVEQPVVVQSEFPILQEKAAAAAAVEAYRAVAAAAVLSTVAAAAAAVVAVFPSLLVFAA